MANLNNNKEHQIEVSTISLIQFGLLSPEEILKRSVAHINEPTLYDSSGEPKIGGLFDPRMGVIERKKKCKTCEQTYVKCPGHPGHIELVKPVYNAQFIIPIRKVLQCVCNHCSKLLLPKNDPYVKYILKHKKMEERLDAVKNRIKVKVCGGSTKTESGEENHGCGAEQPIKFFQQDMDYVVVEWNKEVVDENGNKRRDVVRQKYTPEIVLNILKRISAEDALILGFSKDWCLPHWLIYTILPVAPPSVRPSVKLYNNQRSEDDITHKYNDIIKTNNILKEKIQKDTSEDQINSYVNLIQYHICTLIDNDTKCMAIAHHRSGRPLKTFIQRLKGKEGRIRNNLMGKRVDFSARSVISPDANLNIEELGVPIKIAMNLTYPEIVNKYNINTMYTYIRNGSNKYPGAKSYKSSKEGITRALLDNLDTSKIVLEYGDIINRHLVDGDVVLFNRQPSLHKMSMMAHKVRVMPGKTFRLNVDVCGPYNADFDGDEMNMHVPQSIQTAMELKYLAAVPRQIISPSSNAPIIKPSQDNLLGYFKITDDKTVFTQREVMNIMMGVTNFSGELPEPKNNEDGYVRWTGKQLISMILPNINYSNKDKGITIKNGELIEGQIEKKASGGILHIIHNEYGFKEACRYLNDLQRVVSRYMIRSGFSIGVSDLIVPSDIKAVNEKHIIETKKKVVDITKKVHLNIFENLTKDIEAAYEAKIGSILGKASEIIREDTTKLLDMDNRLKYIVSSGSKGSPINIAQMCCLLDQQRIDGKRIPLGFSNRSLPHYSKYDNGIESKGYIVNNFKDGLKPQEFFFHAMAGREGLIDTAVKTARSGYIQRKLIKTTEDLKANHDYTVRNSNNKIVQFIYGEDGFNPIYLENQKFDKLLLISEEKLQEEILVNPDYPWDKYINKRDVLKMKKNPDMKKKMNDFNEDVHNMLDLLHQIYKVYSLSKGSIDHIYSPVNFKRLLTNVKEMYHLEGKNKCDVTPLDIIDAIEDIYNSCLISGKRNIIFKMLLIDKLSPVFLIKNIRITKVALNHIVNFIKMRFKKSLIQGGEMVGPIAAQSIGELSTQLTLNSVDWETDMLFNHNGNNKVVKMGEFIDKYMDNNDNVNRIQHIPKNRTEYLELNDNDKLYVPSVDTYGNVSWCQVSALTRHLPVGDLVSITTESGRKATATQQKSFLIWNDKTQQLDTVNGYDLKVGDKVPVNMYFPEAELELNISELPLSKYLPKTEWLYGSEFNYAGHLYDIDERSRKIGFWSKNNVEFTLPYSRCDSFYDAWCGKRMTGTNILPDCIYPKKCIRVPSEIPEIWKLDEELGFVVGIYLAEGLVTDSYMCISNNDDTIIKKITDWCDKMKVTYHIVKKEYCDNIINGNSTDLKIHSVVLAKLFKLWCNTGSSNKRVPTEAYTSPKEFAKGILDGYISGDGTVNKKDGSIIISSASSELITGISNLMTYFGIFGKISGHQPKSNNIGSKNIKYCNTLSIRNGFSQIFAEKIGSSHKEKQERLNNITLKRNYKSKTGKYETHSNIVADKITNIEFVKPTTEFVYDITVPKTLNFGIFNGLNLMDTFHFAGVGEKSNVNQGVPRLEELLHQSIPKEPQLDIYLTPEFGENKEMAEQVRYNIELVKIGDVLNSDAVYFEPSNNLSQVLEQDKEVMQIYQIFSELDPQSLSIPNNPWVIRLEFNRKNMIEKKITMEDVKLILSQNMPTASIMFSDDNSGKLIFRIRMDFDSNINKSDDDIKLINEKIEEIKNITIKGVEGIEKVFNPILNDNLVYKEGNSFKTEEEYFLRTNGSSLFNILTKSYIDSSRTVSNNIKEIYHNLGIEAARWMLQKQMIDVFTASNSNTNPRHVGILCDMMTNRGKIMPANRLGINQSDNEIGPLAKCSFEETTEQLKIASLYGSFDKLKGVSSNIMVGQIPDCGTGDSKIILDEDKLLDLEEEEEIQDTTDLTDIFGGSEYCAENQDIGFDLNAIEGDGVNLENL